MYPRLSDKEERALRRGSLIVGGLAVMALVLGVWMCSWCGR